MTLPTHGEPHLRFNARDYEVFEAFRPRFVAEHQAGLHAGDRIIGCPYCYAPGPDGRYCGTTWAELGVTDGG